MRDYLAHKITAMRWFLSFYESGIGREPMLRDMSRDEKSRRALLVSVLTTCTLLGSLVEARKLFLTNKDAASLFHPIASMVTFLSFAVSLVANPSGRKLLSSLGKTIPPT